MYIKDFSVDTVEVGTLNPEDEDPEYFYRFDNNLLTNKTKNITLNHGDSSEGTPLDNGALIYKDDFEAYHYIYSWSRGGVTGSVEELLIDSYVNNYFDSSIEMTANLNNLGSYPSLRMEDTLYWTGPIFMYAGGTINPSNDSEELYLIEITKDEV
jgi:hypothetical protein